MCVWSMSGPHLGWWWWSQGRSCPPLRSPPQLPGASYTAMCSPQTWRAAGRNRHAGANKRASFPGSHTQDSGNEVSNKQAGPAGALRVAGSDVQCMEQVPPLSPSPPHTSPPTLGGVSAAPLKALCMESGSGEVYYHAGLKERWNERLTAISYPPIWATLQCLAFMFHLFRYFSNTPTVSRECSMNMYYPWTWS